MNHPPITPRRPFNDDDDPDGLLESDKDFVLNNLEACLFFLERELAADQRKETNRVDHLPTKRKTT